MSQASSTFWRIVGRVVSGLLLMAIGAAIPPHESWKAVESLQRELQAAKDAQSKAEIDWNNAIRDLDTARRNESQAKQEMGVAKEAANESEQKIKKLQMNIRDLQHVSQMEQLKAQLVRNGQDQFYKVSLANRCKESTIFVAVRYQALNNLWVTRGWWQLQTGQESGTDIVTQNPNIYFYAYDPQKSRTWNGIGEPDSTNHEVILWSFIQQGEDSLDGPNHQEVVFFHSFAGNNWRTWAQGFTCPNR